MSLYHQATYWEDWREEGGGRSLYRLGFVIVIVSDRGYGSGQREEGYVISEGQRRERESDENHHFMTILIVLFTISSLSSPSILASTPSQNEQ